MSRFRSLIRYTHRPRLRRRKIVNPQATPPEALSQITGCQAYQRCHSFACFAVETRTYPERVCRICGIVKVTRHDRLPRRARAVRVWSFMASAVRVWSFMASE